MKNRILGIIIIVIAIAGGIYCAGWLFFFKAIIDIIEGVKAGFIAKEIALGLFKIFVLLPITEVISWVMIFIGREMYISN